MEISDRRRHVFLAGVLALVLFSPIPAAPGQERTSTAGGHAPRLIATSPHLTELVFHAGAGDLLVAVAPFADYPPAAVRLPRVGGPGGLNSEAILALRPDRVLAWKSGTPSWQIDQLRSLGIDVWVSDFRKLEDIPDWLRRFGDMTGRRNTADAAARRFSDRVRALEKTAAGRKPRPVFLQVLDPSLYTLSDRHIVSDILRRCGGRNVIGDSPVLAPRVTIETVLAANPDVIIASGDAQQWADWRGRWREYPALSAVRHERLVFIPGDLLHRPGPRLLDGMERVCAALARQGSTE
jgi:iron complex transport system substrate-binding protein